MTFSSILSRRKPVCPKIWNVSSTCVCVSVFFQKYLEYIILNLISIKYVTSTDYEIWWKTSDWAAAWSWRSCNQFPIDTSSSVCISNSDPFGELRRRTCFLFVYPAATSTVEPFKEIGASSSFVTEVWNEKYLALYSTNSGDWLLCQKFYSSWCYIVGFMLHLWLILPTIFIMYSQQMLLISLNVLCWYFKSTWNNEKFNYSDIPNKKFI